MMTRLENNNACHKVEVLRNAADAAFLVSCNLTNGTWDRRNYLDLQSVFADLEAVVESIRERITSVQISAEVPKVKPADPGDAGDTVRNAAYTIGEAERDLFESLADLYKSVNAESDLPIADLIDFRRKYSSLAVVVRELGVFSDFNLPHYRNVSTGETGDNQESE